MQYQRAIVKGESFANRNELGIENDLLQRCHLERQTLKNALAIATQAPDEFAYNLMKGPGYMAVTAGKVVQVIKCISVEVTVLHGEECYAELKVTKSNTTYVLNP